MHSRKKADRTRPPAHRPPPNPDDWSNPDSHPKLHAGVPLLVFAVLLALLIAYGFVSS